MLTAAVDPTVARRHASAVGCDQDERRDDMADPGGVPAEGPAPPELRSCALVSLRRTRYVADGSGAFGPISRNSSVRLLIASFVAFSIAFHGVANAFAFNPVNDAEAMADAAMVDGASKGDGHCDLAKLIAAIELPCDDPQACELTPGFAFDSTRKVAEPVPFRSAPAVWKDLISLADPSRVWRPPLV